MGGSSPNLTRPATNSNFVSLRGHAERARFDDETGRLTDYYLGSDFTSSAGDDASGPDFDGEVI